jgi:hypothetical protein
METIGKVEGERCYDYQNQNNGHGRIVDPPLQDVDA